MLKESSQKNIKQERIYQSALKHKVRNLRAKVQSLLPIHLCQKIQKRSNRLKNQLLKRRQFQQEQLNSTFSVKKENSLNNWKYSYNNMYKTSSSGLQDLMANNYMNHSQKASLHNSNCCNYTQDYELFLDGDSYKCLQVQFDRGQHKSKQITAKGYHFSKLTNQQIQQIQQDKMYYLGQQKHIKAYQAFKSEKCSAKVTVPISCEAYESVSKTTIAVRTNKNIVNRYGTNTSFQPQNLQVFTSKLNNKSSKKSSIRGTQDKDRSKLMLSSKGSMNQNRFFRNTTNERQFYFNVHENLTRINQQEQVKRILLSMQLKSRQERVEDNFIKIRKNKKVEIQQENLKQQIKIMTAQQKKRKVYDEVGQIVELTEKLRKKCIKRKNDKPNQNKKLSQQKKYP